MNAARQQLPIQLARVAFWTRAGLGGVAALVCWLAALLFLRHARSTQRLQEAEQAFLCAVTHELKTPIGNIQLFADTIRAHGAADPGQVPRFAEIIGVEAERLRARVDEMLLIASGHLVAHAERCDVAQVVTQVMAAHGEGAAARGMTLTAELAPEPLHVNAPPPLLARAIGNLVDNAVKFAGRGAVTLTTMRRGGNVLIAVTDQGPGIPPTERERVFEPFVRLGDPLARAQQGTGLGLTLVRSIASDLGGSVSAEPGRGGGACLTRTWPRVVPTTSSAPATRWCVPPTGREALPQRASRCRTSCCSTSCCRACTASTSSCAFAAMACACR
jgi:signal transduction histidine kinase